VTSKHNAEVRFWQRIVDVLRRYKAKREVRSFINTGGKLDRTYYGNLKHAASTLQELWSPRLIEPIIPERSASTPYSGIQRDIMYLPIFPPEPKRPPPWHLGMAPRFTKAVTNIDRKLQGRILEALTLITENPTTIHGDTIKPLSGEFHGCWRYRIGDYRLVYSPNHTLGDITVLDFASRGAVYGD